MRIQTPSSRQDIDKIRKSDELIIANKELSFQNDEKEKQAAELIKAQKHAEESEEGKGSISSFNIPYNGGPEEKNSNKNVVSADGTDNQIKNLKILIAEDDEMAIFLITRYVKIFCQKVLIARTGVEAVEICLNNPDIDLILMDIKMPVMDGYEATRKIRQFNKDVVIIAQTAYSQNSDKEKAIETGCNDFISKPFGLALLTEIIVKQFKKQEENKQTV